MKTDNFPLISVVLYAHNGPLIYLQEAIRLLQGQSYRHWELLLGINPDADDADRIHQLLEEDFQDLRLYAFNIPASIIHRGNGAILNYLLDQARGQFWAIYDLYSRPHLDALESLAHIAITSPADIISCLIGYQAWPNASDRHTIIRNPLDIAPVPLDAFLLRAEAFCTTYGLANEAVKTLDADEWLLRAHMLEARLTHLPKLLMRRKDSLPSISATKPPLAKRIKNLPAASSVYYYVPASLPQYTYDIICKWIIAEGWKEPLIAYSMQSDPEAIDPQSMLLCLGISFLSHTEIATIQHFPGTCIGIQFDDPWTISASRKVEAIFDVIYTNDLGACSLYQQHIGVLPGGSIATCHQVMLPDINQAECQYDLAFIGYAYPSRKREMSDILPRLIQHDKNIILIGHGWNAFRSRQIHVLHSIMPEKIMAILNRSRYVLCLERELLDDACCPRGIELITPSRGYIESISPAIPIFKIGQRDLKIFDYNIITYDHAERCADIIIQDIARPDACDNSYMWTYRYRIGRLIANQLAHRTPRIIA